MPSAFFALPFIPLFWVEPTVKWACSRRGNHMICIASGTPYSNTPIHTGGGMIESHFWIEIPLKLDNQIMQIKAFVCDFECPYDIVLRRTSLPQLSAWQDYASKWLYIQQISIPLIVRNNDQILPSKTGIIPLALKLSKHLLSHAIPKLEKALHMLDQLI